MTYTCVVFNSPYGRIKGKKELSEKKNRKRKESTKLRDSCNSHLLNTFVSLPASTFWYTAKSHYTC